MTFQKKKSNSYMMIRDEKLLKIHNYMYPESNLFERRKRKKIINNNHMIRK